MACNNCGSSPCGCGNQAVPAGRNGRNGSVWYSGIGAPSASLGSTSDWYVDTEHNADTPVGFDTFYQKVAGVWTLKFVIEDGAPGNDGPAGADGAPGFTTLLASSSNPLIGFTQPAADGFSFTLANVADNSWIAIGAPLFIGNGGQYIVVGKDGANQISIINLQNTAITGSYPGNVPPGSAVPIGAIVAASGFQGPAGPGSSFSGDYSDLTGIPSSFNPSAHAPTHQVGGSDQVTVTEPMLSFSDNTLNNASTTKHGLLPKLSGNAAQALLGNGTWGASAGYTDEQAQDAVGNNMLDTPTVDSVYDDPTNKFSWNVKPAGIALDTLGSPTDNTNLNATTTYHGLLPKLNGSTGQYLRGDGTWGTPAGSGSVTNYPDLADVEAIATAYNETIQVNSDGTGLVNRLVSNPTIDLGAMFNIRPKTYANMNNIDQCGPDLGMVIADFIDLFPNYYDVLSVELGWSDADILKLTYFTAAFNEIGFLAWNGGSGYAYTRYKIALPAGKLWYNSELRMGQNIVEGQGSFYYGGYGNTEVACTHTDWKSLYGSQNDGTYLGFCPWTYAGEEGASIDPVATLGGSSWCHSTMIKDLCMSGTCTDFNDYTYREAGFNYWGPGENSGAENCLFVHFNDSGIVVRAQCAYAYANHCSFFSNGVSGYGIGGISRATLSLSASGDLNPFMFYTYRCGETNTAPNARAAVTATTANFIQPAVSGTVAVAVADTGTLRIGQPFYVTGGGYYEITNIVGLTLTLENTGDYQNAAPGASILSGAVCNFPYWPNTLSGNPGGNITVPYLKLESFACGTLIGTYSPCPNGAEGKGQMLARLTGRFHFAVLGGTATSEGGKCDSLIRVENDGDTGGTIPLSNSSVYVANLGSISWAHWLHDVKNDTKYVANVVDDDTHGSGIMWTYGYPSAPADAFDPLKVGVTLSTITATYKGIQPFINDADPIVWNQSTGPSAGDGWDAVTGILN